MNEEHPTAGAPVFSASELAHLTRQDGAPLTRREIRQRDRAIEAGALQRVNGTLVIVDDDAPDPSSFEPPTVTSADVLGGKVSASTGLTRRQLREIAEQHEAAQAEAAEVAQTTQSPPSAPTYPEEPAAAPPPASLATPAEAIPVEAAGLEVSEPEPVDTGELERTEESAALPARGEAATAPEPEAGRSDPPTSPRRVSARSVAFELDERDEDLQEGGVNEQTARRPVVHPHGVATGEYTGEFDQIRQAMADINAAPDAPQAPPERRSVFEASVPTELTESSVEEHSPETDTHSADLSDVINTPIVTDDFLPNVQVDETAPPVPTSAPDPAPIPPPDPAPSSPDPGNEGGIELPDWQTITSLPAVPATYGTPPDNGPGPWGAGPSAGDEAPHAPAHGEGASRTPLLLVILQWIVITVVAIVLGLLVWYAITRGLGDGSEGAAAALATHFDLLR